MRALISPAIVMKAARAGRTWGLGLCRCITRRRCDSDTRLRTLFYVRRALGRCLEEGNPPLVGKGLCLLKVDLPLRLEIALVADKKLVHVLTRVAVDLAEPLLDVVERLAVGNVVHLAAGAQSS